MLYRFSLSCWLLVCLLMVFQVVVYSEGEENDHTKGKEKDKPKQDWCYEDNCYEILGLDQTVDHRTIKTRYNNLSLDYHPDRNPNQTQADRDKYVKINRAYEILSDSKLRSEYDQYLRIRTSMDSPKEHPVLVLALLYGIAVLIVLQYQKQHYRNIRKNILDNVSVQQYLEKKYNIDLKKDKKIKTKPKSPKKTRKNKNATEDQNEKTLSGASSLLTSVDPTTTKDPYDDVSDEQINEAITQLQLVIPNWDPKTSKPNWMGAFWAIPKSLVNVYKWALFQAHWKYRYSYHKQTISDSDREYLCRTHFHLSEDQWNKLTETQKQSYMGQPGKWKKSAKSQNTKKTQ